MRIFFCIVLFYNFIFSSELISPLPQNVKYDTQKALLGKKLFFDTKLSADGTISCATCHDLENGGDDGLQFSFGIKAQEGKINSPTVLNSRYNFVQFWDGRVKTLAQQALEPIENPIEMGAKIDDVIATLKKDSFYSKKFASIYNDGITKENLADAIAEFEKALVTPSRFDSYLHGDDDAITKEEKEGYHLFKSYGCISCHNGINLGSNVYQKIGLLKSFKFYSTNYGLYNITNKEEDKYYFKVPTLRNIELTAPYFHGGKVTTLKSAILIMAEYQLGIYLDNDEANKIEAFLKSLTGSKPLILDVK